MKCKRCDGDGVIIYYDYQYADKEVCPDCDGNGVVEPMTEQEYLQTCNTEQLAEFLNAIIRVAPYDELEPKSFWKHLYPYDGGKKSILEWLKQPHKGVTE